MKRVKQYFLGISLADCGYTQDFLYLAEASHPLDKPDTQDPPIVPLPINPPPIDPLGGVPEPATLLLWALETLGVMGYGRRRPRKIIKLA